MGTAGFLAPELLGFIDLGASSDFSYTIAVDIWAVGEITFRMLSGGEAAFQNLNELRKYVEGRLKFPSEELFTHGVSEEAYYFTKTMMTAIPDNRPSAENALGFDWLISQRDSSEHNGDNGLLHHTDTRTDSNAGTAQIQPGTEFGEPPSLPASSLNPTSPFIQFDFYLQKPSSDDEIERLFTELMHKRGWQNLSESSRRQMLAYPTAKKWTLVHQDKKAEWLDDQRKHPKAQLPSTTDEPVATPEMESPQWWVDKTTPRTEHGFASTAYVLGDNLR